MFERAWAYKDHGKSYDAVHRRTHRTRVSLVARIVRNNWRLTEIQSAIGRLQLQKLPLWVGLRQHYAAVLSASFKTLPGLRVTTPPAHVGHSYYKYYVFVRPEALRGGWNRDRIIAEIAALGVPCFSGSCSEVYLETAFPPEWRPQERLPVARELGETSLMFMVHPTLNEQAIRATCDAVREVMTAATLPRHRA